ncbi:MAG TPA: hydrolase [Eubacteriaceae bacterium]|nr:hydrolase [Eubacteriaceae bacterium]
MERLQKQLDFIVEIDRIKTIYRQNVLIHEDRQENDAEHSWHLAVMAMLLKEHFSDPHIDLLKSIKMALIHDLVEIYAGDTFCYDEEGKKDKLEREKESANRLFALLPDDQSEEFHDLWEEFEQAASGEAQFAACLDRLQPLLLNINTKGHTWRKPGVTKEKILQRNAILRDNAPKLWTFVVQAVEDGVAKGYIREYAGKR